MVQKTLLSDTPENLVTRYADVLKQSGVEVEKLVIFGSYAKGKNKPWSDLDICVVSPAFGKNRLQESMNLAALAVKVDSMIEPYPCHPHDFDNKYDPLIQEILIHGVTFNFSA
jgi:predicted nucleotidyltransferase